MSFKYFSPFSGSSESNKIETILSTGIEFSLFLNDYQLIGSFQELLQFIDNITIFKQKYQQFLLNFGLFF